MTTPFYSADLYPGMLGDFEYKFDIPDYCPEGYSREKIRPESLDLFWFNENLRGVFITTGLSTAHWATHIQVSEPRDLITLKMFFDPLTEWTENILGWDTRVPSKRRELESISFNHEADTLWYGINCDENAIRDFLRKYPMPIQSLSTWLHHNGKRKHT